MSRSDLYPTIFSAKQGACFQQLSCPSPGATRGFQDKIQSDLSSLIPAHPKRQAHLDTAMAHENGVKHALSLRGEQLNERKPQPHFAAFMKAFQNPW